MIIVKLRPLEFMPEGDAHLWHRFPDAESYYIHDDHTLELRDVDGDVVAHVHHARWDLVRQPTESDAQ